MLTGGRIKVFRNIILVSSCINTTILIQTNDIRPLRYPLLECKIAKYIILADLVIVIFDNEARTKCRRNFHGYHVIFKT